MRFVVILAVLLSTQLVGGQQLSGSALLPEKAQVFFKENCVRCHGPDKEKGSLRVDLLVADLNDHYSLSHYQNIIDEITTQNMPPDDEPQPDEQEALEIIQILEGYLRAAKEKHSSGGGRPVRRLTRTEFINSVWDQLGVHLEEEGLPDDLLVGHFETDAALLFLTDMHIQAYLEKARGAVELFIASRSMKPGFQEIPVTYLPALMNSVLAIDAKKVPPAGYLTIRTKWWLRDSNLKNQLVISPSNQMAEYEIEGTEASPQTIDLKFFRPEDHVIWKIPKSPIPSINLSNGLTKKENAARIKALGKYKLNEDTLVKAQGRMFTHPVVLSEIRESQFVSSQPNEFFAPFLLNGDLLEDSAAPAIIEKFVALVKRGRHVDPEFVEKLNIVFTHGRQIGLSFWEALVEPMAISMCSMDSILHFEDRDPNKETRTISGVELANRLSYSIWRSAPDAELVRLGKSGELLKDEVRKDQIRRMIKDRKFDRFLTDFADQWFELPRQDEIAVSNIIYKDFNQEVKPAMREETIKFLTYLVRKNVSITNLIDSDFMVLNNVLAEHYGISGVYGDHFRAVPRTGSDADRVRGGILTHAGILMQGGTGDRTSIVERGAFIARKIIDHPPGIPPPDVGELPTDDVDTAKMTGAELVKLHASSSQCANCHAKIDPLGMGLEQFDAVGLLRTNETRLNPAELTRRQRRNPDNLVIKVPLASKGYLYDGQKFQGIEEMKKKLMTKKHDLAQGYIKALLSFANGREANVADQAIVERITKETAASDYPALVIIGKVLTSEAMTAY